MSFLLAHQQTVEAELRYRLQSAEKENTKLHRQVAELSEEVGKLKGDLRVFKEKLRTALGDRSRRTFQAAIGSVMFGFAGGFLGTKEWLPGIVTFVFGSALFYVTWLQREKKGDETV